MAHAQLPNQSALAIPRKIGAELRKRHLLVGELSKSSVSNHVRLKLLGAQFYRAGDFEQRRRMKFYVCYRSSSIKGVEECFQIKSAVNLEFGSFAFSLPIAASGESAFAIAPFAMRDIQPLVVPFSRGREIVNFVAASLQSFPAQGRLYPGVFELCDVSAEF